MQDVGWRAVCFFLAILVVLESYTLVSSNHAAPAIFNWIRATSQPWTFQPARDANNVALTEAQCGHAFPSLYHEVDRAVSYWQDRNHTITQDDVDIGWRENGAVKLLIHDNQLRILQVIEAWWPDNYRKRTFYTLMAMHRALLGATAAGEKIPDIEFAMTLDDMSLVPHGNDTHTIWAYTRRLSSEYEEKLWLMPDFQFYAGSPFAGSFLEMQDRAAAYDGLVSEKIPKVVWRGHAKTNELRTTLLNLTEGKEWADVVETGYGRVGDAPEGLSMADQCRYMFLVHTEGRSWSGRLKYLLNCHSLPIIHTLNWTASYYDLLIPNGPEQNFVPVQRDWTDLETKVKYYINHPEEAQRIADNVKKTFRSNYTSLAAETCYWRALMRGYGKMAFKPDIFETVPVNVSGKTENQRLPRGWSFEQFIWSDESRDAGWSYQVNITSSSISAEPTKMRPRQTDYP